MSFNRLIYDTCAYKKNLKESLDVGVYQLYAGKYDNKNKCRVDFGIVGGDQKNAAPLAPYRPVSAHSGSSRTASIRSVSPQATE